MRNIKIERLQNVRYYPVLKDINGLFHDANRIVNYLISALPNQSVTLCGTGTSGAILMTAVLLRLRELREGDSFILLQKPGESTHRDEFMGNADWGHIKNVIVLDDAVSTGHTIKRIAATLKSGGDVHENVVGVIAIDAFGELGEPQLLELFPNLQFST